MAKLSDKTLVIIPTFNERENLPLIVDRLFKAEPERVDVLVVDDASPDGTGEIADEMAAKDSRIHVLHREGKGGLGGAYIAGFRWASKMASRCCVRWMPMVLTLPNCCTCCLIASTLALNWCWDPVTSRVARR